jgi:hypothetical protein
MKRLCPEATGLISLATLAAAHFVIHYPGLVLKRQAEAR